MELEILQGAVSAILFQNYENGYAVLRLLCEDGNTATVVGTIPVPILGERLMVTGKWSTHPSYGRQFDAEFLERLMPETVNEIRAYLSGRAIKGIGPKLAGKIVARFGEDTLRVLEREPERLAEISGISLQKAQQMGRDFILQVGMRHLMEFFAFHHLPVELAVITYRLYGETAIDLIHNDPYLLTEDGLDAPFGVVDQFAVDLGVAGDDPRRIEAGILFELRYHLDSGHSFLPYDKLRAATAQLLSIGEDTVAETIDRLLHTNRLDQDFLAGITIIYLPELYNAETESCHKLMQLASNTYTVKGSDKLVNAASKNTGIQYSPQQKNAIRAAVENGLLIITGGPGTGKTTIVNGILSLYDLLGLSYVLAAPTGRAAKRMTEVTGKEASTIHRLLEATVDPHTGKLAFVRDAQNPLQADAVIVDEMSMVDVLLLHSLLQALPENTRLILVGDPDQLPPVGPGFPFSDMLRSDMLPSVRLTEVFRQAQESLIVMNAHRVNQGEMPELWDVHNDFFFLNSASEEASAKTICDLCTTRLPKNMGIPPQQIQVLSPTKKGYTGTVYLNRLLQASLNPPAPGKKERQFGDFLFREGDRIMQIRNNYDIMWRKADGSDAGTGIFNGDVGVIKQIDPQMEQMTVEFDDRLVDYDFTQLNELELAYAMTVHKSQGSEYRAVILAACGGSGYLLNRSVLYTAITRARELMIITGRPETVTTMVQNARPGRRYTGLKLRLQGKGQ